MSRHPAATDHPFVQVVDQIAAVFAEARRQECFRQPPAQVQGPCDHLTRSQAALPLPDYYVVMLSYSTGREAIVDPEVTRREVVSRIASGEYAADELLFVQHVVQGCIPRDVTLELIEDAAQINARDQANEALEVA